MFGSTGGTTPTPTRLRLEKLRADDRKFLVAIVELGLEPIAADRAEVALDMHAEHLLELAPQMARDQMQRLLVHRASFDRVDESDLLEPALDSLDQRTLARAYRAHQVEDLPALFALERRRMEVADDLRDGALDAEKFFREEIEHLERLILEQPLGARVVGISAADAGPAEMIKS